MVVAFAIDQVLEDGGNCRNPLDLRQKKRLALAGQFALDHPGTRKTGEYVGAMRQRLAVDLSTWMTDMKTLRVQVGIQGPRQSC